MSHFFIQWEPSFFYNMSLSMRQRLIGFIVYECALNFCKIASKIELKIMLD